MSALDLSMGKNFYIGQRVKHRTGELGTIIDQPDSDPIVLFDSRSVPDVFYRSEVSAAG